MTKPMIAVAVVAALGTGLWLGRSSDETARATSTTTTVEPEQATVARRARAPAAAQPRPSLARPRREAARGLATDLASSDPRIRRAAVAEVAREEQPDPQTLLGASRDPDLDVARLAIAGVSKLYADGQISTREMIALASDRAIPTRARTAALNGLGTVPNAEAAALLVTMLATGDTFERRMAAALLGNQDVELAVPALIAALRDADEYVRGNALESLRLRSRGRDFGMDAGAWQAWWQSAR